MREGFAYPELGFIMAQEDQRKGYCLEACSALLEYGFRNWSLTESGSGGGREQGLGGSVQEAGRNPGGKNLLEGKEVSAVCLGGLTAAIRC